MYSASSIIRSSIIRSSIIRSSIIRSSIIRSSIIRSSIIRSSIIRSSIIRTFLGGFSKTIFFLFLSTRVNLVFNIHFGPCYAFLMCKTLGAWQKNERKIVLRRSKHLMCAQNTLRVKNGILLLSSHFRLSGRIL